MFSALAPFLIKWYNFSATQVLVLAAVEPFFAAAVSIPACPGRLRSTAAASPSAPTAARAANGAVRNTR